MQFADVAGGILADEPALAILSLCLAHNTLLPVFSALREDDFGAVQRLEVEDVQQRLSRAIAFLQQAQLALGVVQQR